jgi:hypothetical protein
MHPRLALRQPRFLIGHPRRRAAVLQLILILPISLFFVAAWRLDPDDGLAMVGLAYLSVHLFAYLPLVLWLAYRICGLALGWLAGLGCALGYLLATIAVFVEPFAALTPWPWLLLPLGVLALTTGFSGSAHRLSGVWPRLALGAVGAPVTAFAGLLALQYTQA